MASLSAREQAYQTIRSRIITMELKPGDPLNDRELAEQMGISRTPMREALIMLNIAHMVDIKPQSGTHVAPIDLKRMELEQFARFTLEKEILNRVRGRLTDQQEQEYRQIIENYRLLEADLTQPNRETRLLELGASLAIADHADAHREHGDQIEDVENSFNNSSHTFFSFICFDCSFLIL